MKKIICIFTIFSMITLLAGCGMSKEEQKEEVESKYQSLELIANIYDGIYQKYVDDIRTSLNNNGQNDAQQWEKMLKNVKALDSSIDEIKLSRENDSHNANLLREDIKIYKGLIKDFEELLPETHDALENSSKDTSFLNKFKDLSERTMSAHKKFQNDISYFLGYGE